MLKFVKLRPLSFFRNMSSTFTDNSLSFELLKYSEYCPHPIKLKQMVFVRDKKHVRDSYEFIKLELPVRFANMITEMVFLPEAMRAAEGTKLVTAMYHEAFSQIRNLKDYDEPNAMEEFANIAVNFLKQDEKIPIYLLKSYVTSMSADNTGKYYNDFIQYFLIRFFASRLSVRLFLHQLLSLMDQNHSAYIPETCHLNDMIQESYEKAATSRNLNGDEKPKLNLTVRNYLDHDESVKHIYIPAHLNYILLELFKNSIDSMIEKYGSNVKEKSINVRMTRAREDICILIKDTGKGIPASEHHHLFNFLYTSKSNPADLISAQKTSVSNYGFDLPFVRLHSRYLGGDLDLVPVDGYGMYAMLYLKTESLESSETLPRYTRTARHAYENRADATDWTDDFGLIQSRLRSNIFYSGQQSEPESEE